MAKLQELLTCAECSKQRRDIKKYPRNEIVVYNGRKLEHGYEEAIRDGKIIILANAISFIVRIF